MNGLYPEENIPFHLPVHAYLPAEKRPTFFSRFLTSREEIQLDKIFSETLAAGEGKDKHEAELAMLNALPNLLQFQLTGFAHITDDKKNPIPFSREGIATVLDKLSIDDGWQLHKLAKDAIALKREELGKSASPSPSPPANTALPASPTAAAATTA